MTVPKSVATNLSDYFNLPNPGLRAYLAAQEIGQPEVITTPFWRGRDFHQVANGWMQVLTKSLEFPALLSYEVEQSHKIGPMSVQKPLKDRMESIRSYYVTPLTTPHQPLSANAISDAVDYFGKIKGLRLRSIEETVKSMELRTSSGSPYYTRRRSVLNKTVSRMHEAGEFGFDPEYKMAAVLGWRGQEGGPTPQDTKQRVIWQMPMAVNIQELRFNQPLVQGCQKTGLIPSWIGKDAVDLAITKAFDDKRGPFICTDFNHFDQSYNPSLQESTASIYRQLAPDVPDRWFTDVFPVKYNIPLVISLSTTLLGPHAMASGSGGTNGDETTGHTGAQFQACEDQHATRGPYSGVTGDDGYLYADKPLKLDGLMTSYGRLGLSMNKEKQYISDTDVIYLRNWHSDSYRINDVMVGVYPTMRALGRLKYQERYYDPELWNAEMVTLRAWQIIENCCWHPLFTQFVDYVLKGDKFRLGLGIPGFLDRAGSIEKEANAKIPYFTGFNASIQAKRPIKDW